MSSPRELTQPLYCPFAQTVQSHYQALYFTRFNCSISCLIKFVCGSVPHPPLSLFVDTEILDHKIRTYVIRVYDYFSSIFPFPFLLPPPLPPTPPHSPRPHPPLPAAPPPPPPAHNWCSFVTCVTWMHRRVVLWDWELMHFQAYVYIIFVYRFVYVDMSTRSSQINHLSLESWYRTYSRLNL